MPGHQEFGPVNPNEFRNFIDAKIGGIPGNLTRQDLANMYEDYNKFFGRSSQYVGARVPGTASNLIGMIPKVGWLKKGVESIFGPPRDTSLQGKYTVDNAGFGSTGARDEFGLATFDKKSGFLGLKGDVERDYVDRMSERVDFLETDFFSDIMGDTDFEDLTETQITAMRKKNGFNFKQLQAYKNRLATEAKNRKWEKQQAEIEKQAQLKAQQEKEDRKAGAFKDTVQLDPGTGGDGGQGTWHGQTRAKERQRQQVAGPGFGQGAYFEEGGLASMFTRRR
jgi:hypothetical protein